jgi:ribonuclease BN (tRNA processing enzyme)
MKKKLTLQVIGSGNALGSGGRFNSCIYVESRNYRLLLDCGASTIVALRKMNVDIFALDAIILTHLHGDHFGGVPLVEVACRIEGSRQKPLNIFGPNETKARVNAILPLMFPEFSSSQCEFNEYQRGENKFDYFTLTAIPALHSPKTNPHSLRLELDEFVLAFSGDTQWYDGLASIADNADIFICECSSIKSGKAHMSYESLLANQSKLNAKRIVLNHLGNDVIAMQSCRFDRAFDGQTIIIEKEL